MRYYMFREGFTTFTDEIIDISHPSKKNLDPLPSIVNLLLAMNSYPNLERGGATHGNRIKCVTFFFTCRYPQPFLRWRRDPSAWLGVAGA